jgi:hypothetical protein
VSKIDCAASRAELNQKTGSALADTSVPVVLLLYLTLQAFFATGARESQPLVHSVIPLIGR